jgi:hypothetical protein
LLTRNLETKGNTRESLLLLLFSSHIVLHVNINVESERLQRETKSVKLGAFVTRKQESSNVKSKKLGGQLGVIHKRYIAYETLNGG